jgi:hypothetical protein
MDIKKLVQAIIQDIKSGDFKLQMVFNRNITNIENAKKSGVSYKRITDLVNDGIENKISQQHLNNLIFRAKKKCLAVEENNNNSVVTKTTNLVNNDNIEINKKESLLKESLKEWRLNTNFDLPERLILRAEKVGLNSKSVHALNLTKSQLSTLVTKKERELKK